MRLSQSILQLHQSPTPPRSLLEELALEHILQFHISMDGQYRGDFIICVVKDFRYPFFQVHGFVQRRQERIECFFKCILGMCKIEDACVIIFRLSLSVVSPSMNIWLKQNSLKITRDICVVYTQLFAIFLHTCHPCKPSQFQPCPFSQ